MTKLGAHQIEGGVVQSIQPGANVTIDNTDPQHPVVSATGGGGGGTGTLLAVVAATASSSINTTTQTPDKAFDGDTVSKWLTNATPTGWLRAELSQAYAINRYSLSGESDAANMNRSPKDWTLEGSNDGTAWTVLDARTGQTGWTVGQVRSFTFTNSTAYLYYRLNISANNGGSYTGVTELILGARFLRYIIP